MNRARYFIPTQWAYEKNEALQRSKSREGKREHGSLIGIKLRSQAWGKETVKKFPHMFSLSKLQRLRKRQDIEIFE